MLAARVRLLTATLWAGSLWTIGYLVAPVLFSRLADRALAGSIVGALFRIEAWLSVVCGLVLLALLMFAPGDGSRSANKAVFWIVSGMLACTLIGYFGLQPFMAVLRETVGTGGVMASQAKAQFGILHGISSTFYLIESLLGIALILKLR